MPPPPTLGLRTVIREWGRIGCIGFGGPPAHIALLRELCVKRREWLSPEEFEDAIAATNLLPGPGSTQMAIFCAWRLAGVPGAFIGGLAFIVPGLIVTVALSALFLATAPPDWIAGAGAGAGAAVAAVAVQTGLNLLRPGWQRVAGGARGRWLAYVTAGLVAAAAAGPWLVLLLLGCGGVEWLVAQRARASGSLALHAWPLVPAAAAATGGLGALVWVAFKVGALAYGGGFVIIPLMRADAVGHHHWMSAEQFLNAVAIGQVTPGPVVHTVAVVGYAAAGVAGALLAAAVAFSPSFAFVLLGADRFDRLRGNSGVRAFLDGAGPAAMGAIIGAAIPLAAALGEAWQFMVCAAAAVALVPLRRGVVATLLGAGAVGVAIALAGGPLPR